MTIHKVESSNIYCLTHSCLHSIMDMKRRMCQFNIPSIVKWCFLYSAMLTSIANIQKVLTNTDHVTPCIVMLKDVITISLMKKGQNDRIKNVVLVSYGTQWPLINFELSATIMTNSSTAQTIALPAPKWSDSYTHWPAKTLSMPAVHTIMSTA